MKNHEKFNQCIESFYNGQLGQARGQVDKYGQKAFLKDIIGHGIFNDFQRINIINRLLVRG